MNQREWTFRVNSYAQELVDLKKMLDAFRQLSVEDKREVNRVIASLTVQARFTPSDITIACSTYPLRASFTPCVLLSKNCKNHTFLKLINLPEYELEKVFVLFLFVFKQAYVRSRNERFGETKWWELDLRETDNIRIVGRALGLDLESMGSWLCIDV